MYGGENDMENSNLKDEIINLEHDMWEAALKNNSDAFKKIVSEDAIMICGGERCLGSEYAEFIKVFNISSYSISDVEVIYMSSDIVQLHYVVKVEVAEEEAADLSGRFHVASLWKKTKEEWQLVFNMDSRIG
jgi:hypothetical protein